MYGCASVGVSLEVHKWCVDADETANHYKIIIYFVMKDGTTYHISMEAC